MLNFIKRYPRILAFGIVCSAFSGPGQTFLISLFIPSMRESFNLTQSGISGWYSLATLISACALPILGRLLDRFSYSKLSILMGVGLILGCIILGLSSNIIMLVLGFVLVRYFGQGGLSMLSSTSMAKLFGAMRGKALGIANMGYPLAEALLPGMTLMWMSHYGWKSAWFFLAGLVTLVFLPLVIWLLSSFDAKTLSRPLHDIEGLANNSLSQSNVEREVHSYTLSEVFKDWRFYTLVLPAFIPPLYVTGLFFHQASLIEQKGWSLETMALGFVVYAIFRSPVSFIVGPFIDKYSARVLFPASLIPMGIGLFCFGMGNHTALLFPYMAFMGVSVGFGMTVGSALWAEMYGTEHLGSIRGMTSALMVLSTAIAPIVFGALLDAQVSADNIVWGLFFINLLGIASALLGCRAKHRP
ncbi:MAG: MFS family permease [Candidatus Omnitrophota bacterium]|jgi:MFS family permease